MLPAAQIAPDRMRFLSAGERLHRLAFLSTELYGDGWLTGLAFDMRVHQRTVRRWKSGKVVVPKVVLVALGAMLAERRSIRLPRS